MDQFPDSPLWIGVVPTLAWQAAVQLGPDHLPQTTDDDLTVQWRAAGIVDGDGNVNQRWAQALSTAARAADGMVLAAWHDNLAFLSNVHLGDTATVVARSRATVAGDGGEKRLDTMEPVVEVTLCEEGPWPGIQRVLPPLDEFTSAAQDGAALPMEPGATPPEDAASMLNVTVARSGEQRSIHWYLHEGELHRIDDSGWYRVRPGDVAHQLTSIGL